MAKKPEPFACSRMAPVSRNEIIWHCYDLRTEDLNQRNILLKLSFI